MREVFYDQFCLLYDVSTEVYLDSFKPQDISEHTCFTVTGEQCFTYCHVCITYCLLMNYDEWDILVSCRTNR
jgi:hypothetical protein